MVFIVIPAIIMYIVVVSMIFESENIVTVIFLGATTFLGCYVVGSGVLFWGDVFSPYRVLIICYSIGAISIMYSVLTGKKSTISYSLRPVIIPLIIIFLSIPFAITQFEFFGMGQDQGVYQTNAIRIMYGDYSLGQDFEEYYMLETSDEQEEYTDFLSIFTGFYRYVRDYPVLKEKDFLSEAFGFYHGIPTCSALLALAGLMFGIQHMALFNLFFYFSSIYFSYQVCENINLSKINKILVASIVAFSPISLWVAKSALTESLLALMIVIFVYFMTLRDEYRRNWLAAIPIVVFSFYHVSIYTVIPLFLTIFIWQYLVTEEKQYLLGGIISTAGFAIGFMMMQYTSAQYTYDNCRHLVNLGVISENGLFYLGGVLFIITVLTSLLLMNFGTKNIENLLSYKLTNWIVRLAIIILVLFVAIHCWRLANGMNENSGIQELLRRGYYSEGIKAIKFISLIAYAILSGLVILPLTIAVTLIKPSIFLKSRGNFIIAIVFFYTILFMSAFFRKEVYHYYYYSRYLALYIPIVAMAGGIVLEKIGNRYVTMITLIISLVILIPFDYVLATTKDDTRMTWNMLESIEYSVADNAAILFDDSGEGLTKISALAIREMTNSHIYPLNKMNYEEQVSKLSKEYDVLYLFTSSLYDYEVVFRSVLKQSLDLNFHREGFFPLPRLINQTDTTVTLYILSDGIIDLNGNMSLLNNTYWDENSEMYVVESGGMIFGPYITLQPGDYILKVDCEFPDLVEKLPFRLTADTGKTVIYSGDLKNGENTLEFYIPQYVEKFEVVLQNSYSEPINISDMYIHSDGVVQVD